MGRIFELRRWLRVALALSAVTGGGLISYGVVLNRYAPAACLLLLAVSCLSHMAVSRHPYRQVFVASVAGFLAALAASIDPATLIFAILLCLVLLAMCWSAALRSGAILLYLLGALPVVVMNRTLLHAAGLPLKEALVAEVPKPIAIQPLAAGTITTQSLASQPTDSEDDTDLELSGVQQVWNAVADWIGGLLEGIFGLHGVGSHFPVLMLGVLGALLVLHRNWPESTKAFAVVILLATLVQVLAYSPKAATSASYGAPWFVSLSPLLMFWGGAWLKRPHRPQSWVLAGVTLALSVTVALVGMSNPMPRQGYHSYSVAEALTRMFRQTPVEEHLPPRLK
jgi:hypothetical protein